MRSLWQSLSQHPHRSALRYDGCTLAHANCNAGVLEVMHPEDPVHSCDKCNGQEYVPLEFSSGEVEWLGECHRAIGVSEAHYSGGYREDGLHDATHISTASASARATSMSIWLSVSNAALYSITVITSPQPSRRIIL